MLQNGMIETEVKFLLDDPESMRLELAKIGGASIGNYFEKNQRYDDTESSLLKKKCLLRLRSDKSFTLTFKKTPQLTNPEFKINHEYEVEVSDIGVMEIILNEIGFSCVQTYEKMRETFIFPDAKILVDMMPYASFAEIEGSEESIKEYSDILGFDWNQRITLNYLEIFENIASRLNLQFKDVTFDNFRRLGDTFKILPEDLGI